jgi:hypothetical protein
VAVRLYNITMECPNCEGTLCMMCVFGEDHYEHVADCPECCPVPYLDAKPLTEEILKHLFEG